MTKPNRQKLTPMHVQRAAPKKQAYLIWDTVQRGLALRVEPTSYRAYKVIYRHGGRTRWLHLAAADAVSLADARKKAAEVMLAVMNGNDPAADKKAERGRGTFEELAARYVEEYAKKKNRSWAQAEKLVQRNLLPRLGKLQADKVTRSDVKAAIGAISAPITANQTLAAASAIFSWAIKEELLTTANPCQKIERHDTVSRDRILSDHELPQFFAAFDLCDALKVCLLTGQRPGEVAAMRWQDIQDGWWTLPGKPDGEWPGTKNGETHRVWLPQSVHDIIGEDKSSGFVFTENGKAMQVAMREICKALGVANKVTPHDLRRTHGSTITRLGCGRDAMNRIQNHRDGGIASVYDRHEYADENKRVMEAVASHIMALATGETPAGNVVSLQRR